MTATRSIVVIGAGGQAREVAQVIDDIGTYRLLGFVVSDLDRLGNLDSVDRVLGDYAYLERNASKVDALALGIGTPASRLRVAHELSKAFPRMEWPELVHPTATVARQSLTIGSGAYVAWRAVCTVNVTLEEFCLVNFGCTVAHEAVIGRGSVINPGANVSGGVRVGEGALVGTGAQILQYRSVGTRAVVGAGAVVTRDVPDEATVVGVPARRVS